MRLITVLIIMDSLAVCSANQAIIHKTRAASGFPTHVSPAMLLVPTAVRIEILTDTHGVASVSHAQQANSHREWCAPRVPASTHPAQNALPLRARDAPHQAHLTMGSVWHVPLQTARPARRTATNAQPAVADTPSLARTARHVRRPLLTAPLARPLQNARRAPLATISRGVCVTIAETR